MMQFSGDCFGVNQFGPNWGWAQPGYAIIGWMLQASLGYFYDNQIDTRYVTDCYGRGCFTAILIIVVVLNFLSLCLNVWFWIRQRRRMSRDHETIRNPGRELQHSPPAAVVDDGRFAHISDHQTLGDSTSISETTS